MSKFDESMEGLRTKQRAKRRKTNFILNSLIGLVLLLIILVSVTIFAKNDEQTEKKVEQTAEKKAKTKETTKEQDLTIDDDSDEEDVQDDSSQESEPVITTRGEANVKKTVINPAWKPVGTTQTGEHVAVYEDSSVDWQEMIEAIAYATELEKEQLTIWRIESNGPNQSVGTVSTKDKLLSYRVYIEWQDNEGWAPTRVEELMVNDKAQ
jgi:cytoskeletal protein RodZ